MYKLIKYCHDYILLWLTTIKTINTNNCGKNIVGFYIEYSDEDCIAVSPGTKAKS